MDEREHIPQETVEFTDPTLEPAFELPVEEGFPLAWRGYDRQTVDAHVADLESELERFRIQHEPDAAVKHEIERIGSATSDILRVAQEKADRITTRAQEEADARLEKAQADARRITAAAEERLRALDADADVVWQERRRLIDDTRRLADKLLGVADDAVERFPEEDSGAQGDLHRAEATAGDTVAIRPIAVAEPEHG